MNEQIVTPEYLLSHGFVQYNSLEEGDCCDIPFWDEYRYHFRELLFARQMFVVVIDKENLTSITVYVQVDAGCGFIEIPFPWSELSIEYFESVYYGIRGEKPKYTGPLAEDAEFEIVEPKQIQGQSEPIDY